MASSLAISQDVKFLKEVGVGCIQSSDYYKQIEIQGIRMNGYKLKCKQNQIYIFCNRANSTICFFVDNYLYRCVFEKKFESWDFVSQEVFMQASFFSFSKNIYVDEFGKYSRASPKKEQAFLEGKARYLF